MSGDEASRKIQEKILDSILEFLNTEPEVKTKPPEKGGSAHQSFIAGAPCYNYTWDILNIKVIGREWARLRCKFSVCAESEGDKCKIRIWSGIFSEAKVGLFGSLDEKPTITSTKTTIKKAPGCPDGIECVQFTIQVPSISMSTPVLPSGIPYIGGLGSFRIRTWPLKEAIIEICANGNMRYMDDSSPDSGTTLVKLDSVTREEEEFTKKKEELAKMIMKTLHKSDEDEDHDSHTITGRPNDVVTQ